MQPNDRMTTHDDCIRATAHPTMHSSTRWPETHCGTGTSPISVAPTSKEGKGESGNTAMRQSKLQRGFLRRSTYTVLIPCRLSFKHFELQCLDEMCYINKVLLTYFRGKREGEGFLFFFFSFFFCVCVCGGGGGNNSEGNFVFLEC